MKSFLWACLCACVLLVGCEGSEPSGPGEEVGKPATSLESFIEKVDEICAGGREQLGDIQPPGNLKDSGPFLRKILPVIRDQQAELRELGDPPAEKRSLYLDWFQAREGIVETTALMIAAAEDGDEDQFRTLAATQADLDRTADKAAAAYGLTVCGSSG